VEAGLERVIAKYQREPRPAEVPAWVLPPMSCAFLSEAAALVPDSPRAFEFGSGQSTRILRENSPATTSIENSREWLEKTETNVAGPGRAGDFTRVISLGRCWNRLRPIESFDLAAHPLVLEQLQRSRLILVDSPPNPAKREHALYLALENAPPGAIVILDDLEVRAVTRFASRLARQNAGLFRFWILPIDHQLGVFLKLAHGRVRSWPSLREFVGTWMRA
jgi:hypothetical protein